MLRQVFSRSSGFKTLSIVGIVVIAVAIPFTVRYLSHPTNTKTKAFAGTSLSLLTNNFTFAVGDTIPLDIDLNPGGNLVSLAKVAITYDSSKLSPVGTGITTDQTVFPVIVEGPVRGSCVGTMCTIIVTLSVGADPTKVVTQETKIGTVTFKAIANTGDVTTEVGFDQSSQILSISPSDQARENVLGGSSPADITITNSSVSPSSTLSEAPSNTPSTSPGPSNAISPTDTPIPGDTIFSLNIFLHAIGNSGDNTNPAGPGNLNPLHPQRNVYVDIYNTSNQLAASQQGVINYNSATGSFQGTIDITYLPTDYYFIKIHSDGYLIRLVNEGLYHATQGITNSIPDVTLITGDINNDNQIDIQDYNALISCYGTNMTTGFCFNPTAVDLNDDGVVDGADYNLFLRELTVHNGD